MRSCRWSIRGRFPTLADYARNIAAQRRVRRQLFGISQFASERHNDTVVGFERRALPRILQRRALQTVRFIVPLAVISAQRT